MALILLLFSQHSFVGITRSCSFSRFIQHQTVMAPRSWFLELTTLVQAYRAYRATQAKTCACPFLRTLAFLLLLNRSCMVAHEMERLALFRSKTWWFAAVALEATSSLTALEYA